VMDQNPSMDQWQVFVLGVLGALNVALNSWLVHRRYQADRRENGKHRTKTEAPPSVSEELAQAEARKRNSEEP
jgi:hypothetical protein